MAFRGVVVSFWRSESLIISQLDVQSHHIFSSITLGVIFLSLTLIVISFGLALRVVFCFCLAFRSTSSFGVQSHHSFTVYDIRSHHATLPVRSSKPSLLGFGIQSHHRIFVRHSEPSLLSIGVQSHSRRIFSFGIQSHHHRFSISAFRAIITPQFDIKSHILSFGVQSHHHFLV